MSKTEIGARISPYPMPVVLVGAIVDNRPNFMTVAWINRLNGNPPIWGLAIGKNAYTLEGIKTNKTFSINFPGVDLVDVADYCGIVSGRKVDKSKLFKVFYGKLESAPMIQECPLTIECRVYNIIELPKTDLVLGEIAAAYTEEKFMSEGKLDPKKINPFMLTQPDDHYWGLGEIVADAFTIGKTLKE
ncbi:MAG: flavin reductase family protein [Candidatus Hodarchaeota archaeon]